MRSRLRRETIFKAALFIIVMAITSFPSRPLLLDVVLRSPGNKAGICEDSLDHATEANERH